MQNLSTRQQSILNRVVDTHIQTAQPVGSHMITALYQELYQDSYSSATVRHEMGILERMGYLTHPHTSAGRVPTDLGYRYYVDYGIQREALASDVFGPFGESYPKASDETEEFFEKASRRLSELSDESTVILFPVKVRNGKESYFKLVLGGATRLISKPEFQNVQKIRLFFEVLETKRQQLTEWLMDQTPAQGVSITIGHENAETAFQDCSFVSSPYSLRGGKRGVLAIIGPRRMKYSLTIPLVEKMSRFMGQVMEQMETEEEE